HSVTFERAVCPHRSDHPETPAVSTRDSRTSSPATRASIVSRNHSMSGTEAPAGLLPRKCGGSGDARGLEQRLCGPEVGCGESLGEAGVGRAEDIMHGRSPSLLVP